MDGLFLLNDRDDFIPAISFWVYMRRHEFIDLYLYTILVDVRSCSEMKMFIRLRSLLPVHFGDTR